MYLYELKIIYLIPTHLVVDFFLTKDLKKFGCEFYLVLIYACTLK